MYLLVVTEIDKYFLFVMRENVTRQFQKGPKIIPYRLTCALIRPCPRVNVAASATNGVRYTFSLLMNLSPIQFSICHLYEILRFIRRRRNQLLVCMIYTVGHDSLVNHVVIPCVRIIP